MICPHCQVSVPSGKWTNKEIIKDNVYDYSVVYFHCVECQKVSIKFVGRAIGFRYVSTMGVGTSLSHKYPPEYFEEFILPKTTPRNPIHKDVEEIFRVDYDRGVKLLTIDPMASAAYSRRLLQHYIQKKHKIKAQGLKNELKKLKKLNYYPADLIELFSNIKHYGDFAAHAKTDQITGEIIDIDPDEAEWLLVILEEMFEYDYARKSRIKESQRKLQDKLQRSNSTTKKKKPK